MRRGRVGLRLSADDPPTVTEVLPGSPAARAGLRPGDALHPSARSLLSRCRAGVSLTLSRPRGELAITPEPWPEEAYPDLDVTYGWAARGSLALRTIVVTPRERPRATVLYAQGHDVASVERATVDARDPLRGMVEHLARAGYSVARVERRGVGDSTGDCPEDTSWTDEREDLAAALASLDTARVVILGHSLGAMHTAALAPRDPRVCGVILYGAGIDPWRAYLDANLRRQLALAEVTDARVAPQLARFWDRVLGAGEDPREALAALEDPARAWITVDPAGRVHGRAADYWRGVDREDIPAGLSTMRVPALALWGESDALTDRDEHARIAAHTGGSFATVPRADHGFADFATARDSFRAGGRGPWQPRVGDALTAWLGRILDARGRVERDA